MWKTACVSCLTVLVGLVACNDDISSASRLRRPRLLAVQAEPPNPSFGQTTRLRPLVYLPAGESVTYEWSWCPAPTSSEDGYVCPVGQAAVDALAAQSGLAGIPPLALGSAESIELTNPFPASLLASLCAGDSATTALFLGQAAAGKQAQVFSCALATLPVQVMLTIRGSITETGVVSLRLPIDETTPGNGNPVVGDLSVVTPDPVRPLDPTGVSVVPRDTEVRLHVDIDPTQAEVYLDRQLGPDDTYLRDGSGQLVLGPTVERLSLSWFAEGGGFQEQHSAWGARDLDDNGQSVAFASALENLWTTPTLADYPASASRVLVVVRDSRGGVAWTDGTATLGDAP